MPKSEAPDLAADFTEHMQRYARAKNGDRNAYPDPVVALRGARCFRSVAGELLRIAAEIEAAIDDGFREVVRNTVRDEMASAVDDLASAPATTPH